MSYSEEQVLRIEREKEVVIGHLQRYFLDLLSESQALLTSEKAREYLQHGVCRRINILRRCIHKIFEVFPPNRKSLLESAELAEVEINLHAFVMNLNGALDNLAWVFVHENGIESLIQSPINVGLFKPKTQGHLPSGFRAYLSSKEMKDWHKLYAKDYRDALAHRIPLYVPPATVDPVDEPQWQLLQVEQRAAILKGDILLADRKQKELEALQSVCDFFVHSHSEGCAKPLLHPQILCDGSTVIEVLRLARKCFKIGAT